MTAQLREAGVGAGWDGVRPRHRRWSRTSAIGRVLRRSNGAKPGARQCERASPRSVRGSARPWDQSDAIVREAGAARGKQFTAAINEQAALAEIDHADGIVAARAWRQTMAPAATVRRRQIRDAGAANIGST